MNVVPLSSSILFSWDSDEEAIDTMPNLVERAGTIHEMGRRFGFGFRRRYQRW
jgi:hypothetical protein